MPILIAALAGIFVFCALMLLLSAVLSDQIAHGQPHRQAHEARAEDRGCRRAGAEEGEEGPDRVQGRATRSPSSSNPPEYLLKAEEFILGWAAAAILPAGLLLFFGGSPVTAMALAAAGAILPPFTVSMARKKRLALFEKQLGDALGLVSNCLRSGFTFQQAMESIAREMAEPISKEFAKTLREMRLGVPIETAMENIVRRMNNPDLDMLVSAVLIQRQVGGNLADIIDNISVTIRERLKIKGDVKVMSASGRISGMVIGLLPVFLMGILMFLNPNYVLMFFQSTPGIIMLCIAGFMELIGFLIVQKIVDIKF